MSKERSRKSYIWVVILTCVMCSIFSITFTIGVFDNPNFTIQDFCMNLASELAGLVIALLVVDAYIRAKRNYLDEKTKQGAPPAGEDDPDCGFEVKGAGVVKSVTTLRDKQTGVRYLLVIHEQGSGLTPLLDGSGSPVIEKPAP